MTKKTIIAIMATLIHAAGNASVSQRLTRIESAVNDACNIWLEVERQTKEK